MRVAVCVATYRRPASLSHLMESLTKQELDPRLGVEPLVVVVDNDDSGSARGTALTFRDRLPGPLHYAVEPRRNISHARNRAIEVALREGAEWVAFIDDDEVAGPHWLAELVRAQRRFSADVVTGPVLPLYQSGIEPWVIDGGFFTHPRYETGAGIRIAATGNVLVAAPLLARPGGAFDPLYGLSGGGDSHFFLRARAAGARMVWADEAVVEEFVPLSRGNARWLVQRAFRLGNGGVFCESAFATGRGWMLLRCAKSLVRLGQALLLLPVALLQGRGATVARLQLAARSLGALLAVAGVRYQEYKHFASSSRGPAPAAPERAQPAAPRPEETRGAL